MLQKWEEINIPVPWGSVAGKWWGSKEVQPIIAIHGQEDNAGSFDTLAPLLVDEDTSILCIDLPGHGLSSHLPDGLCYYQVWDGVILLRRIAKYFRWTQISIMGHSLGGSIGFLYAATFPGDVYKYISLDVVAPLPKYTSVSQKIDEFLRAEQIEFPDLSYPDVLEIVEDAHKDNLTQKSCEILMKRGIKFLSNESCTFSRDVRLRCGHLISFSLEQVYELALNIKCQVLNIRADPGQFGTSNYYEPILQRIKQNASLFEYHRVPGTHHVHLNHPERICDIIQNFLKS